jgi:hypothetical protein
LEPAARATSSYEKLHNSGWTEATPCIENTGEAETSHVNGTGLLQKKSGLGALLLLRAVAEIVPFLLQGMKKEHAMRPYLAQRTQKNPIEMQEEKKRYVMALLKAFRPQWSDGKGGIISMSSVICLFM